jgi:hypothetical protein
VIKITPSFDASALDDSSTARSRGRPIPADATKDLFNRDGYARIESLASVEEIAQVRSLLDPLFDRFESLGPNALDVGGPREQGAPLRTPEINEAVHFEPALRKTQVFLRCRELARHILGVPVGYVFDHAIYKAPRNERATAWHQDEAYNTQPIPLWAVHFWIPLQPVNVENGCMQFVPGSHRIGLLPHRVVHVRPGGATTHSVGATVATDSVDASRAVACPLELGGATIHHPLTLHYTGPNQSDGYRKAWILHFAAFGHFRFRLHPKCVAKKVRDRIA